MPIRIRNTAVQVTVAFVAVLILIGAFFNIDFIRRDTGVAVRWNGSEADLFVYASVRGFETSYLLYPWSLAREFFYVPPPANHLNDWLIVFRITPAGIERHAVKPEDRGPGSGPGELTPIDGQIYANYPAIGGLCRWAGDHFELATDEERHRLHGIEGLWYHEVENGPGGWSARGISDASGPKKLDVKVGDHFDVSLVNHMENSVKGTLSVDVLYPGKPPQRIVEVDGRPRRVSSAEFQQAMRGEPAILGRF